MSVVTGTTKASNGGAPAPGGDGPVDISNWNMYGRASSGRPVVWLVGPVVGTCTETSARWVCVCVMVCVLCGRSKRLRAGLKSANLMLPCPRTSVERCEVCSGVGCVGCLVCVRRDGANNLPPCLCYNSNSQATHHPHFLVLVYREGKDARPCWRALCSSIPPHTSKSWRVTRG